MPMNRQIVLAARPAGYPKESDFDLVEKPVPTAGPVQMLIRIVYLSLDPYMRGMMSGKESYLPSLKIGDAMMGGVERADQPHLFRRQAGLHSAGGRGARSIQALIQLHIRGGSVSAGGI